MTEPPRPASTPVAPPGDAAAGDAVPANARVLEIRIGDLHQLFNSIDPAPFRKRDLDPKVDEFIVDWSRDLPNDAPLALLVRLDRPGGPPEEAAILRDAIHEYFRQRAESSRRRLAHLFRNGRISLLIGLGALTALTALAELLTRWTSNAGIGSVLHQSLLIGGWVAMWRPLEVFLYDWWPIRGDIRLFDRLAAMPVRLSYSSGTPTR